MVFIKWFSLLLIGLDLTIGQPQKSPAKQHVVIWTRLPNGGRNCSGSIINNDWILSSASCLQQQSIEIEITFFRKNTNIIGNSFKVAMGPQSIVYHPNNSYDISLLKLPMRLRLDYQPGLPLYKKDIKRLENEIGLIAAGPSKDNESNINSFPLRDLKLNRFNLQFKLRSSSSRKQWNSGAGIYINISNELFLIGVSTTQKRFTYIAPLTDWIEDVISIEVDVTYGTSPETTAIE